MEVSADGHNQEQLPVYTFNKVLVMSLRVVCSFHLEATKLNLRKAFR